ncbi:MAG TPA: pirin family protein [Polyangia bacterium]|jgi:hypothetical protein|nr:pirin family protein [Polyangia bacterium]
MESSRTVTRVITATRTLEGAGFEVRRPFPTHALADFDPFLLLDEMGPVTLGPGEAQGAPDHPHRGFETVTYVLSGRLEHRDSRGHHGQLGPGDVQWMTAGRGIVHSEMPEADFRRTGGRMHGFQLWVNLPRRDKMMEPRYQEIPADRIPVAKSADGLVTARVIAGEALGVRAVIDTRTPIFHLHFTLQPGGRVLQPVPRDHQVFAYVFGGEGRLGAGAHRVVDGQMALFGADGEGIQLAAPAEATGPVDLLLIGGVPLREPVARYGPFVMNHQHEILQAFADYRNGRLG